jgi:hypothetical protein
LRLKVTFGGINSKFELQVMINFGGKINFIFLELLCLLQKCINFVLLELLTLYFVKMNANTHLMSAHFEIQLEFVIALILLSADFENFEASKCERT